MASAAVEKWRGVPAWGKWAIFGVGLVLTFTVPPLGLVILLVELFFAAGDSAAHQEAERQRVLGELFKIEGFTPTHSYTPSGWTTRGRLIRAVAMQKLDRAVAVDEQRNLVVVATMTKVGVWKPRFSLTHKTLKGDDVLEVEIRQDDQVVEKASTGSVVGRALLGDVLAGRTGAIIGGATAKRVVKRMVTSLQLRLIVNDLAQPNVDIRVLGHKVKENSMFHRQAVDEVRRLYGWFKVVIARADQAREPARVEVTTPSSSVADELRKLDQLRRDGVLTQAEFDARKAKVLA